MTRVEAVAEALGRALGIPIAPASMRPVSGGCIHQAFTLRAGDDLVFVKASDGAMPRHFEAEAEGLRALAASGTSLRIPRVLAHDDSPGRAFLALEHLAPGPRRPDFDELLGVGLAELHRATSERGFGFSLDGYCGATPQPNRYTARWVDFFREQRLGHQLQLALRNGLAASVADPVRRCIDRLDEWLDDDEPPALVHGDLWSGNLLVAHDGRPALVDPAAYHGHREAELGMMRLFGNFSPRVYAAYQRAWPLRPGHERRVDLYALYHVLNHYNLFGSAYARQAQELALRCQS